MAAILDNAEAHEDVDGDIDAGGEAVVDAGQETGPAADDAAPDASAADSGSEPAHDADKDASPGRSEEARPAVMPRHAARDLQRVATRIFGTPLLVSPDKLAVILAVLGPRLGIAASPATSDRQADASVGAFLGLDDDDDDDGSEAPYQITSDGIAVLCVDGTLVYKSSWLGALSGLTAYGDVRAALDQAVADPAVKGILMQVDSYGGEVNGCFDLSDAIFAARAQKPVYAVAADDAYSAAYALAAAASKLFVSRTSGVGSIGVVALHVDQSGADKMSGLKYTYIYSGDHKIDGNPHAPLSTPALDAMQAQCDRLRGLFASSVARYRGLSTDEVLATQASCFFGEDAVTAKLADAVGTPADALTALRVAIGQTAPATITSVGHVMQAIANAAYGTEPATSAARTADVVDLARVREEVLGESAEAHVEIVELCALAGRHNLAATFIRDRLSLSDVRRQLQTERADASDALTVHGHLMPDAGETNPKAAETGWEKAIVAARGSLKRS